MIFLLLLLDVLVNNFTSYSSYFFIVYLYNKSYKYYLLTGLTLDFIIFNNLFLNTILLSIIYLVNKIFKDLNKNNFYNYIFIIIFNYLLFIILSNILMRNSISNTLILLGSNLVINIMFYVLCYRTCKRI
ncbi:MAG: hypothetical protein E7161_03185 [Firmicutes bacterium]|nr:hypothetical protein [Bacillota bacterium]